MDWSFKSIYPVLSTAFATSAIALAQDILWRWIISLGLPSGLWRIQILPWWRSSTSLNVVVFIIALVNACVYSASILPPYLVKYFPCRFLCCTLAVLFQRLFSLLFYGLHMSNPFCSNKTSAAYYNWSSFSFFFSSLIHYEYQSLPVK